VSGTAPLLEASGVVARYRDVDILRGVSIRVEAEELVAILGPNGAGKSTLLKAIVGLLRPRAGTVRLEGRELAGLAPEAIVRLGVAYVPQVANVFPSLTVAENLAIAAPRAGGRAAVEAARAAALAVFPALGPRLGQRAGSLSGGERQMLAMARALAGRPRLLLLDEPTAALAPQVAARIMATVGAIRRGRAAAGEGGGPGVLLAEQNARLALATADRAYVLEGGENALEGRGADLLADPRVRELYLGGDVT
jgi:neutral amino acid transport system ATP-binding protein